VKRLLSIAAAATFLVSSAHADVKVGVIFSGSGPAASLGIPAQNAVSLFPATLGGEPVTYVLRDDGSDPTTASRHAQELVDQGVDLIIGAQTVPATTAVAQVAATAMVPQIAPSPIAPSLLSSEWIIMVPQPMDLAMRPIVDHMKANGVKTVGYIGFADPLGDLIFNAYSKYAESLGITTVAAERYNRTDTSVSSQVLKVLAAKPDAVVIGGTGSPGALPQIALAARHYHGQVYQNLGVINADYLKVGGTAVNGTIAPTGPVMVAEQLTEANGSRAPALKFLQLYEGKFGTNSRNAFAAYYYDAYLLADDAVSRAKKVAQPGSREFRVALKDALATTKELIGVHAVYSMHPGNHNVDLRSIVLVKADNGQWTLLTK
jgi:branched-chain amino acid transport system substrate-binding protein